MPMSSPHMTTMFGFSAAMDFSSSRHRHGSSPSPSDASLTDPSRAGTFSACCMTRRRRGGAPKRRIGGPLRGAVLSSSGRRRSCGESVSESWLGDEVARIRGVGLELAPQLRHVYAQVVGLGAVGRSPDFLQQLAVADELAL